MNGYDGKSSRRGMAVRLLCRTVPLLLTLTLLPAPAGAADTAHEKKAEAATEKKQHRKKEKLRPFTPSERIGADQAVAFPVDI